MLWNKANQILELETANESYANTQNLLDEKIAELDSQVGMLQAALEKTETALVEANADLDQNKSIYDFLDKDNARLHEEHNTLIDEFNEVCEAHKDLNHRYELLESVLKQLHIPVTLSAKKK